MIPEIVEKEIELESENITINGIDDYEKLKNKPRINGEELIGNKTLEELGYVPYDDTKIKKDIKDLQDNCVTQTELNETIGNINTILATLTTPNESGV